jgi:RNA processing factor Prp31
MSARFKIKFSPDKVDTMVVQAIALLDDLDKEINIYAMRVKVCLRALFCTPLLTLELQEWYGWHFPEMAKIITDNIAYAKVIKAMGESRQSVVPQTSYLFIRIPHQRRRDRLFEDPPRRSRGDYQGCLRDLHGHRNL